MSPKNKIISDEIIRERLMLYKLGYTYLSVFCMFEFKLTGNESFVEC